MPELKSKGNKKKFSLHSKILLRRQTFSCARFGQIQECAARLARLLVCTAWQCSFFVAWNTFSPRSHFHRQTDGRRRYPENGRLICLKNPAMSSNSQLRLRTITACSIEISIEKRKILKSNMNNNNNNNVNNNNLNNNNNNNNNSSTKCPPSFCSSCHKRSSQPPPIQVTAKVLFGSVTAISALNAERKKKSQSAIKPFPIKMPT